MKHVKMFISLLLVAGITFLVGCKKDEEEPVFNLVSLTANGIDLAGVTAATNVPEDAVITAVFSSNVDEATATSTNFAITYTDGGTAANYAIAVDGATVTITPANNWDGGTQYTINMSTALKGKNGAAYAGNTLTFRTSGIYVPNKETMVLHLSFDDQTATDETGIHSVSTLGNITYTADRRNTANAAAYFDGSDNLVQVAYAADLISPSITISFWMKTDVADYEGLNDNDPPQSRFVYGLGAELGYFLEMGRRSPDPTAAGYPKFFMKFGTDHVNIGNNAASVPKATAWTEVNDNNIENYDPATKASGWTYVIDDLEGDADFLRTSVTDKWIQVVLTMDAVAQTKTIYIDGVKFVSYQWNSSGYDWLLKDLSLKTMANDGVTPIAGLESSLALGNACSSTSTSTGWCMYDNFVNSTTTKGNKLFKGAIDEFRIFSIAFSETDVQTLYDNEK